MIRQQQIRVRQKGMRPVAESKRWFPIWVMPLVVLFAVGTVWLRLNIVRTTYSISQMDHSIRNLQQEKERAELAFSAIRSPRRLEQIARTQFNLTQPRADQVVHLQ